jgi:hypothetical protein
VAAALNWSLRIELVKRIEGRPILLVFRPRKMPRERQPPLKVGGLVRGNRIFPQSTRREMKNVHLFFLKLFGCMICEAKANGHEVPIDIAPFSNAIMSGQPHPDIAVSIMFAQAGRWEPSPDTWHPLTGSNRFRVVDFWYKKRAAKNQSEEQAALITASRATMVS